MDQNNLFVDMDSAEVSFRPSRGTQSEDYSINSRMSTTNSHLQSPVAGGYIPVGAFYPEAGLRWDNQDFINNCNTDSFVSFIKLMSLKHPNMLISSMRLKDDEAERTLKEIIEGFQSTVDCGCPQFVELMDNLARKAWVNNVMGIAPIFGQRINLAGDEGLHIFNHLKRSMKIQWSYQCQCRPSGYQYDTVFCLGASSAAQITEINHSVDPSVGPRHRKRCKGCHHYPIFQNLVLPKTTWLIRVLIQNPNFDYINLPNFFSAGTSVFKLGYVTFVHDSTPTIRHQTSAHLIKDQWFHYDGMRAGGKLIKLDGLSLPDRFKPESALYFKWADTGIILN